jgi:hypothetical protein
MMEAEARGELRARRDSGTRILQALLQQDVPAYLQQMIDMETDWAVLDRWFHQALNASTPAEAHQVFAN